MPARPARNRPHAPDRRAGLNNQSLFGALPLDDAEIDRIVVSGVDVFLRAYRPAGA